MPGTLAIISATFTGHFEKRSTSVVNGKLPPLPAWFGKTPYFCTAMVSAAPVRRMVISIESISASGGPLPASNKWARRGSGTGASLAHAAGALAAACPARKGSSA